VIFNQAVPPTRVDVETEILCDVLPDGTIAKTVLLEPVYDVSSGDRIGTRTVDPATGQAYTPQGELKHCPGENGCDSHTELLCDTPAGGEPVRFLRRYSYDCATGEPDGHTDLTLDGAPYTVTGTVGACIPPQCDDCETIQLCDRLSPSGTQPGVIRGDNAAQGVAENGIGWTVLGDADAPFESVKDTADGAWWTVATYPNAAYGLTTVELDSPATVAFSVVMRYSGGGGGTPATAQLPAGLTVINLPAGYAYDAATGRLTVDATANQAPCSTFQTPLNATSARFLITTPVPSFQVHYLGAAAPACTEIGPFQFGGITLNPEPTSFLRTICRTCDGTVTAVTDTALNGTTPYTVLGTPGACQPLTSDGPDREMVCYRSTTSYGPCSNVQITDIPQPRFTSARVVDNPLNFQILQDALDTTFNGDLTGAGGPSAPTGVIDCDQFQGNTAVVIDYRLSEPRDNVTAVRLWNGFGGIVTDNDGIGSATVTLYNAADAVLFTGPLVTCTYSSNSAYATPCVTPVGNLDGVTRMRLSNLAKFPTSTGTVAPDIGWREIDLFSSYEATLTVDCGGAQVSALVEGAQPGVTYADGTLTQVNGPHTLTFTVPGGGSGRIVTDNPSAFSALDFEDGSVITLTGNAAVDFAIEVVSGAAVRSGYVEWGTGVPTVRDANSGDIVGDAVIVPCIGPAAAPAPECQDCETLILCDSGAGTPATITGTASSGTLPNGIAWTARNAGPVGEGNAMPPKISSSDGAWWGLHSFPNLADAPTKFTLSRPSIVEFSVYLIGSTTNPPSNVAQLPAGLDVVQMPDGYSYDAASGLLTRVPPATGDPCSYVTDPQTENLPRFRTRDEVTTFVTQPGKGSRIAACTTFFTYYAGAITVIPSGQFLRRICRDCTGQVTSVTDTELDGVTPYTVRGTVGQCTQEPPCNLTVVDECTYSLPDRPIGFDPNSSAYPGCWLATAPNPTWGFGDRVTSWEGTYGTSTGSVSAIGFLSADLGGEIDFTAFAPAIPLHPTQSAPDYVGTATIGGVTVTLRSLAGNGLARNSDPKKLNVDQGDRIRVEFSKPVRLTLTSVGFGDPPAPHFERLCDVVTETAPWQAVKLADCQGRITVVDANTRASLPASAVLTCGNDACCQPVQVCIQQIPVQTREFISNEQHRNDNSIDPVWKWTTDLSVANPPWYDMYQFQFSADWTVRDSDTARPAWWVSPHPDGRSAQASPPRPNEGPSLLNTHWYPRAFFDLPDNADPATIRVQATVFNADQAGRAFRLNDGAWQPLPATATHNGTTYTFGPDTIPGAKAGRNALYLDVEETVGGGAGLMVHLRVFYQVIPETRSWTRMVCCDDSIYYLDEDGQRQDSVPDGWRVAPCFLPPSSANG
jgi:hypothetical protein